MASNNKQGRSAPIAIWGTAFIVILLAVYALHSLTRERVSVHTATVTYKDLTRVATTNGKVDPIEDFEPRPQSPSEVQAVYVDPMQHVRKGQLLLKLDDAAAQATLAHADASLQAAKVAAANVSHGGTAEERATVDADLKRANMALEQDAANLVQTQKLQGQGAASQAEVAAVQHRIQMDEANLQALHARAAQRYTPDDVQNAEAQVTDARASIDAAKSALSNAQIRSPIDGTVYYLPVGEHDFVSTEDVLIGVADLHHMRVTAYFDEPDIGSLAVGQPVTITWEAKPGVWHGHVSRVPTTVIAYLNRFVGEAVIDVDDADGTLMPHANVNLKVTLQQHPHVLSVPRGALKFDRGGQSYMFRIQNGKLVRTNIGVGLVNLNDVEVASGLSQGDVVATNATSNVELTDGESVTEVSGR
ncbi:MAG TPA: efflux RND transporter periplasmic adaptor subunit [Acidobacteriaceae bacterium]|nr:efflux RND transporter periplasmic adaptor subunit [Acidobacteriaceae bacterium]